MVFWVISRNWSLAFLLLATVVIGFCFELIRQRVGGTLLDAQMTAAAARETLLIMTADQKSAHFWGTVVADTVYPLAYGALFAGTAWRFAGRFRRWAVVPAIAAVGFDFLENTLHALALSGNETLLSLKDVITPAKFTLLLIAVGIAAVTIVASIIKNARSRRRDQ